MGIQGWLVLAMEDVTTGTELKGVCKWTVSRTCQMNEKAQLNGKEMVKDRRRYSVEEKIQATHR